MIAQIEGHDVEPLTVEEIERILRLPAPEAGPLIANFLFSTGCSMIAGEVFGDPKDELAQRIEFLEKRVAFLEAALAEARKTQVRPYSDVIRELVEKDAQG